MEVSLKNTDLARELQLLEKIVAKKPSIAVLANVLFSAENGRVHLAATDLEIGLTGSCAAEIQNPGTVTLPAKRFLDMLKAQSDATINLVEDGGAIKFSAGQFKSRLTSLPAADFVTMPEVEGTVMELPKLGLKRALHHVRFAISDKEQSKYFMKAALMILEDKKMTFVATDTSRLAISTLPRTGAGEDRVLIPSKCVDELLILLSDNDEGHVDFSRNEQHLFFRVDDRLLYSRQIEGKFPDYDRVIPQANDKAVQIHREHLSTVVRRHILINDVILFSLKDNTLDISSAAHDVGESSERIAVVYPHEEVEIRFRGSYVLDFLSAAQGDQITLSLKDSNSPALFTDGDYRNVVMGMRV